MLKEESRSFK